MAKEKLVFKQNPVRPRDFTLTGVGLVAVFASPLPRLAIGLLGGRSLPFPLEEIALFVIPAVIVALIPVVVALYLIDQKRAVFYGVVTFGMSILSMILDRMFVAG